MCLLFDHKSLLKNVEKVPFFQQGLNAILRMKCKIVQQGEGLNLNISCRIKNKLGDFKIVFFLQSSRQEFMNLKQFWYRWEDSWIDKLLWSINEDYTVNQNYLLLVYAWCLNRYPTYFVRTLCRKCNLTHQIVLDQF